jgi:BRCA1-associated protein
LHAVSYHQLLFWPTTSVRARASMAQSPSGTSRTVDVDAGHPDAGGVSTGRLVLGPVPSAASSDVCVQSVPGLMTASDFCTFMRPRADTLRHLRMMRPAGERNRYLAVARFKSPEDASAFAEEFEGRPFLSGLIKDTCTISAVESAKLHAPRARGISREGAIDEPDNEQQVGQKPQLLQNSGATDPSSFPSSLVFPAEEDVLGGESGATGAESTSPRISSSTAACPVCLEWLTVSSGAMVTTLCNHTMHAACLSQWDLDTCPVCRHTHSLTPEESTCITCGDGRDLWMCVVCAYVGCGFYTNKHAQRHFEESQHPFAVILDDCEYWSGDKIKAGIANW